MRIHYNQNTNNQRGDEFVQSQRQPVDINKPGQQKNQDLPQGRLDQDLETDQGQRIPGNEPDTFPNQNQQGSTPGQQQR